MDRYTNWPERWAMFIEMRRHRPFEWGKNDCAIFPADGVKVMTGVDLAVGLRIYHTELGAARVLKRLGGMAALASRLTEKSKGFAQRADVVLAVVETREMFGFAMGNGRWCAPGAEGLVFRPMSDVTRVFGF